MIIVHSIEIVKFPHPDWLLKSSAELRARNSARRVYNVAHPWRCGPRIISFADLFYNSHRFAGFDHIIHIETLTFWVRKEY